MQNAVHFNLAEIEVPRLNPKMKFLSRHLLQLRHQISSSRDGAPLQIIHIVDGILAKPLGQKMSRPKTKDD
jgi:hypothetical protein